MITAPGPGKFSVSISLNSLPGMAWGNSRVAKGEEVLEVEERRQAAGGYERKLMGRRCTASEGIQCIWTEPQAAMGVGPGGQRRAGLAEWE